MMAHPRPAAPPAQASRGGAASAAVGAVLREATFLVVMALVAALVVKTLVVQPFKVPSESMMKTLNVGDTILTARLWPRPLPVRAGDVIVFHDPGGWMPQSQSPRSLLHTALEFVGLLPHDANEHLVKRVIGAPGDRIQCFGPGALYRNGRPLEEPYVVGTPCDRELDVVVPAHAYWVMGDNRDNSADSRFHTDSTYSGFVPQPFVVGRVVAVVWPLSRITIVGS